MPRLDPPPLPPHLGPVASSRPLAGGSIARTWAVTTVAGRHLVVKATPYDATMEAEGLAALADVGAPVPAVHHVGDDLLVMDLVGDDGGDPAALGAALAAAHDPARTPAGSDGFGWHRDNLLGTVHQHNAPTNDWPTFFVEQRVRPHLPALPPELARRLERACDARLPEVLDHDVRPALLHGDLWPGNIVGDAWLVDPAIHRGDAEVDLATAELFGGVPATFHAGYTAVRPLDDGWQDRRPLLQLPILLAHVVMFGHGWAGAVAGCLDRSRVS